MEMLTQGDIKSLLKERKPDSNKTDYGHALIVAGKKGMMGAAVIASTAALRSGVGLLTVCVPSEERLALQVALPEAMLLMREESPFRTVKFSALGIGPAIGTDQYAQELLASFLSHPNVPLVLDADALTILSANRELLEKLPQGTIITPHSGEFDRLFGVHQTREDRILTAMEIARDQNLVVVLKGHSTAIITAKEVCYNSTGNAGLAKGGSGDALTGVITSFLAQGYSPETAAKAGVFFHGLAADITLAGQSVESMLISDVISNFGKTFVQIRG